MTWASHYDLTLLPNSSALVLPFRVDQPGVLHNFLCFHVNESAMADLASGVTGAHEQEQEALTSPSSNDPEKSGVTRHVSVKKQCVSSFASHHLDRSLEWKKAVVVSCQTVIFQPISHHPLAPHRRTNTARYDLEVVPEQDYKSNEFKLGSFRRPHMRAFHYAWFGFFAAKVAWNSTAEVLPFVTAGFAPSDAELRTSMIINLVALALTRLAAGPICDGYGPRVPLVAMLCLGSVPVALVGAVNSLEGLYEQRFFVGIIAGTLVSGEFWASRMFAKEVVGTANALVAGWGDLGAGTSMVGLGPGTRQEAYELTKEHKSSRAPLLLTPLSYIFRFASMTTTDLQAWRTSSC